MNASTKFTTPGGEELVLVSRQEYDRLVQAAEDAEDLAIVLEHDRRLAAGEEEALPSELVDRLLSGRNKIRVWREHRGLAVAELARRAGLSQAYVSQLESGARKGPTATLQSVARALNLTLDDLV